MIPSRLNRFCCNYFKESPTIDYFSDEESLIFLFGMRNEESTKRAAYTDIWINENGAIVIGLVFCLFASGRN